MWSATKEKKGGLLGIRTDKMKKAILGALAALILCAGFVPAHATPDTSAPTLDLFQLSKSSVDTGTEDRSITLTAELSDPSGIRNASFYCNESVWFSLFPGSNSASIKFDSIGAVRTTASVSETGSSTDIRWVVTFTVPENRPASTCNWRWAAQDLAGNNVNPLLDTGQALQIIEGAVPPDTSAPTLDLFQLSKSSVDTGTEDRSITLTAELSDPSGIRNASFYCNESVWFSLFPGSNSASIKFDSIGAVRTTASVSETGSSTDIRWVVTFTVPENRPASTCNWRWAAQDLAGNNVNPLLDTGQALQIIEGAVPPDTSAPTLSSISPIASVNRQLSKATLSFEIGNPGTLQQVRVMLRSKDGSWTEGFSPSLMSQTAESWSYSTQISFSPYMPAGAYTLGFDFMHSGSAGNWVNGETMDITVQPAATSLSLSAWELDQSSGVYKAQISGTVSDLAGLTRFGLTVCNQTVNLPFGGSSPASSTTPGGYPIRIESSKFDATTGNYSLGLFSASSTEVTCQVSMVKDRQNFAPVVFSLGSTTIPAGQATATGVEQYRGHGPDDGDFSVWTKILANGTQMKFYGKYLQPGQKVQFMIQNSSGVYEQVAWKRVTEDDLADDGSYTNLQNHVYFIRTIDLKPGKNRVRILVDGEIVWGTKTYTLK